MTKIKVTKTKLKLVRHKLTLPYYKVMYNINHLPMTCHW